MAAEFLKKEMELEEHFLTAEVRQAWNAIGLEASDPSVAFDFGPIEKRLLDLADERLALMDENPVVPLGTSARGPSCLE
jgi:hypothetical protein